MTDTRENKVVTKKMPAYKVIKIVKFAFLIVSVILSIVLAGIANLCIATWGILNGATVLSLIMAPVLLIPSAIIAIPVIMQLVIPCFSFLHITQLFLTPKQLKRKPIAIIFRILTVLFGIASIVFVVLFATKTICAYDFLRSVILFTGGSIVLNVFVE